MADVPKILEEPTEGSQPEVKTDMQKVSDMGSVW